MSFHNTSWPHAPTHELSQAGTYFVTAATYLKAHHFHGNDRLTVLHRGLLTLAGEFGWQLEAWAVFSNHYHFVGHSPHDANTLGTMLRILHSQTSSWINRLDNTPGRVVWHNFWDTRITFQRAYFARLNYVHQNPVRHGLVSVANQYSWGSAAWFECREGWETLPRVTPCHVPQNAGGPAYSTTLRDELGRLRALAADPVDPSLRCVQADRQKAPS